MKPSVVPEDVQPIVVAALYKFVKLPDYAALREPLLDFCRRHTVYGTLLLAGEGINGTIAGSRAGIDAVLAYLRADTRLGDLQTKESLAREMPFLRMKVKLKKEIVTLGVSGVDPTENVGHYVPPKHWNTLISDPEVLLIDTRNRYEVAIGSFENAVNPDTTHFREFPDYVERHMQIDKNKKIAMYCTGGIRCEKATAYLLKRGFKNVYHLQGGILKYLEETPAAESLWQGECFVFDARVAVDHDLSKGCYTQCYGCRHPLSADDTQSPHYQAGVCCPFCYTSLNEDKRSRVEQRHKQVQLAKARGERHLGAVANSKKRDKLMI